MSALYNKAYITIRAVPCNRISIQLRPPTETRGYTTVVSAMNRREVRGGTLVKLT